MLFGLLSICRRKSSLRDNVSHGGPKRIDVDGTWPPPDWNAQMGQLFWQGEVIRKIVIIPRNVEYYLLVATHSSFSSLLVSTTTPYHDKCLCYGLINWLPLPAA